MSLELINTLGTLTTVAIVAAAAIAALVQLRHLRAGNQINAMISIGNQFDEKKFTDALLLVQHNLARALEDPAFRKYVYAIARGLPPPDAPQAHVELNRAASLVGNTYEEVGILLKNEIIDKRLFLDRYCVVVVRAWSLLERATAWARKAYQSDAIWENFEYLAVLSQDYMREHPSAYPPGVRRLQLPETWPLPAAVT